MAMRWPGVRAVHRDQLHFALAGTEAGGRSWRHRGLRGGPRSTESLISRAENADVDVVTLTNINLILFCIIVLRFYKIN